MGLLKRIFGSTEPPAHVSDANFRSVVLESPLPVVLDVWSPNCGPCKQLEAVMMHLRRRYDGRVTIAEMNSRGAMKTAAVLRITATPTVLYFEGGKERERVLGFRSSLYHEQAIEEVFGISPKG
ncbi:MAG: thioredoxin domain-containing protein [Myxococcota bacterium]